MPGRVILVHIVQSHGIGRRSKTERGKQEIIHIFFISKQKCLNYDNSVGIIIVPIVQKYGQLVNM